MNIAKLRGEGGGGGGGGGGVSVVYECVIEGYGLATPLDPQSVYARIYVFMVYLYSFVCVSV